MTIAGRQGCRAGLISRCRAGSTPAPATITRARTFGLSWQDYEVMLPFRDLWNIAAYAYLHNGQNPSLVRYDQSETSGGIGIVLKE